MAAFYYTEQNQRVVLDVQLNDGGQGVIFRLNNKSQLKDAHNKAAKLFKQSASPLLEEKLYELMKHAAKPETETAGICYPQALLYPQPYRQGGCVGFVMNYQKVSEIRFSVCTPKVVRDYWKWSRRDLCRFAVAMLKQFVALHKGGLLMGDVNDRNVLAKADNPDKVFFVDVDSYQIGKYPSGVHTPEFDPPRLMDCTDFEHVMRKLEDEYYSVSALLFKIFLVGLEPFSNGGVGTLEQNRRERKFMFPPGYDSPDTIRGPWQRIWYNLPLTMRQAFYDTFHDKRFISPLQWMVYINEYYVNILSGRYPDVIFIPRTERPPSVFLGTKVSTLPQVEDTPALRKFDNWLTPSHPIDTGKTAYLEFGAAAFRVYEPRNGTTPNIQHIRTGHFDFISPQGLMDIERLAEALQQPDAWPRWQRYLRGVVPTIGRLKVFGCAGLRHLINRGQVVEMLRQRFGLNVGIVSQQEEALAIAFTAYRQLNMGNKLIVIDVGGMATTIVERLNMKQPRGTEIPKLGSKVMRNGFFATTQPDSRLLTKLDEHDDMVSHAIARIPLLVGLPSPQVVAMGILAKIPELTGISMKNNHITKQKLEEALRTLTNELSTNRPKAIDLKQDIEAMGIGENLTQKTELRLSLPVYLSLMHRLHIDKLPVIAGGIGKAYIYYTEKNI